MNRILKILFLVIAVIVALDIWSCQHSPIIPVDDDMMPIDTMEVDTMDTDTMNGIPCDPDIIYFDKDILPILNSNCAFSGCHDAASAENGVILDSYENVLATVDVEPFNLDDSELYEVLTDNDEEERMPPAPTDRLNQEQIQIIAKWILQGADDLECDPGLSECDTMEVSFANDVQPLIVTHCQGCHSGATPSGGIDLSDYAGIKVVAENGFLVGAISWESGFEKCPREEINYPIVRYQKYVPG